MNFVATSPLESQCFCY